MESFLKEGVEHIQYKNTSRRTNQHHLLFVKELEFHAIYTNCYSIFGTKGNWLVDQLN